MRPDEPIPHSGFLMRLLRDQRAATLPIMAAAVFPLAGLVGGGIDMGRMYLTKTRLQQACDAGALGGRKVMAAGTWNANANAANTAAERFFDANFGQGDYGTGARTRTFTESGGAVTGNVSAVVPMTIMRIFNQAEETIEVTCSAQLKLPNTDVMFVLDLSGSMARDANNVEVASGPTSRIVALRAATKCFYEVVALIDTLEDCDFTPSGGTAPGVQVRFGFVNYGSMVNVGKLLPGTALADRWTYQTREELTKAENYQEKTGTKVEWGTPGAPYRDGPYGEKDRVDGTFATYNTTTNVAKSTCTVPADAAATGNGTTTESVAYDRKPVESGTTRTETWKTDLPVKMEYQYETPVWTQNKTGTNGTCVRKRRRPTWTRVTYWKQVTNGTMVDVYETRTRQVFDKWRYAAKEIDVSALKAGATSITLPIGNVSAATRRATDKPITWDGCIEERKTAVAWPFSSITSGHWDLDITMGATSHSWTVAGGSSNGPTGSQWGPSLAGIVWARGILPNDWYRNAWDSTYRDRPDGKESKASYAAIETSVDYAAGDGTSEFLAAPFAGVQQPNSYHCPAESRKLQVWPRVPPSGEQKFEEYVNTLQAGGNTYYDVGLIWGARLMHPDGMFKSENATTGTGGTIERHIIFMTDGNVQAQHYNRTSHGLPWFDRRQNGTGSSPSHNDMIAQNHARLAKICTEVRKIPSTTLWVVGFGAAVSAADDARLLACAGGDTSRYFSAKTNADLKEDFRKIAATISQLKLTS